MRIHSDDGISLLGESTYEILSESSTLTEDEDDASSIHSFDAYNTEDITSFDDSDSVHDYTSDSQEHPGIPRYGGLDELHVEENITVTEMCESSRQIEFDEPPCKNGQVSVMQILLEFDEQETAQILQHLRPENFSGRLLCTLRQTMSQDLLFLDEPFRLLYVGTPSARDQIQKKIGAALAIPAMECASSTMSTDSQSSRFNVVPVTSFGTRSSPEVELIESFGVELAADTVTQAKSTKIEGKQDSISLCLGGNQWIHSSHGDNGIGLEASGWKLPHLAIIFCSEEDSLEMKQTRATTRAFLSRHSVATLFITNKAHCHMPTENYALNVKGIHVCLESTGLNPGDGIIHKRLPVDLATFTSLDVRQMNRNLASLTGLSKAAMVDCTGSEKSSMLPRALPQHGWDKMSFMSSYDAFRQFFFSVRDKNAKDLWSGFVMGCILLATVAFSIAYIKPFKIPNGDILLQAPDQPASIMSIVTGVPSGTDLSPSLVHSPKSALPTSTKAPASCATSVDLTTLLHEPTPVIVNDSQRLQFHIIGDNNIILRLPQKYVSLRKPPQLAVQVTRNGKVIDTELSKVFDGMYKLVIPRDDAWGVMNVSVTTNGKPIIRQSFELDFGAPWFKFDRWKRLANPQKVDLAKAAAQFSADAKRMANEVHQLTLQKTYKAQEVINGKISEASTEFKHLSRELTQKVSKLYEDTLPLKLPSMHLSTADYVKKAQRQAVKLWARKSGRKIQN